MFKFLSLLLVFLLCWSQVAAQQTPKEPPKVSDDDVIRISSNLVNVDVTVRDKKGKAITDLKAEDFILTENGVRQNIEFFDATLSGGSDPAATSATTSTSSTTLPRNIISLVLDGQTTDSTNLKHVRDGMTKYIREHISEQDSVAIFSIAGGLQLLQSFTQNKAKLIAAVERFDGLVTGAKTSELASLNESISAMRNQLGAASSSEITTPEGGSSAAQTMITRRVLEQYIQFRSVLSAQQTRPVLAGLAAICEGLRSTPGKKTLVVFSQGFIAPQNLDWQVQSTIDIANRANVAIYIIDAGGLTGGTPQSGALVPSSPLAGISAATDQESRIRAGAGESVFDITRQEGINRQQDLLYRISGDTGGQFIKNTNDIASGLDRIDEQIRSRYTLAYRSTDPQFDGTFRKVKIEVRRPDAKVVARPGYYAIPATQIVPISPEDRKLIANFQTLASHSTLPLNWQLDPFRSQPGYYVVPLSFEIPPSALEFGKKGQKQLLQLDVIGFVRNEGEEKILSRLGGNFEVELTGKQFESILNDMIFFRQDMLLGEGDYTIDLIVKDRLSGKVSAKRTNLTLPSTDSEFAATTAVLSRHAEPVRPSRTNAEDVLSTGTINIRPSPTREFQTSDNLIIFFKLYNAAPVAETGKPSVLVTVTLKKDGKPAVKPLDYQLTEVESEPVPHLTFAKYVQLKDLKPGKYKLLIEARDMVQQKTIKQESELVITR